MKNQESNQKRSERWKRARPRAGPGPPGVHSLSDHSLNVVCCVWCQEMKRCTDREGQRVADHERGEVEGGVALEGGDGAHLPGR